MTELSLDELKENFAHFDTNADGRIDLDEFKRLMLALGAEGPEQDLQIGFTAIDTDGSGSVDFDEFANWFASR